MEITSKVKGHAVHTCNVKGAANMAEAQTGAMEAFNLRPSNVFAFTTTRVDDNEGNDLFHVKVWAD